MHLSLEQLLSATPRAIWPFVSEPEKMNRWSEAKISERAAGDADLVGMLRRIQLGKVAFDEVIEIAEAPHRLVYRVIDGLPIRHHRGEITLADSDRGTLLRWDVEFTFPLPGMGEAARYLLERPLRRSLLALAEVVAGAEAGPVVASIDVRDEDEIPALRRDALAILEEQRALATSLEERDDPKRWFARVYSFVTENQITLCDARAVPHPSWVLRLIPRFHHYYASNLRGWIDRRSCEPQWRTAFAAMESKDDPLVAMTLGFSRGVRAHVEEDLPRALAEIFVRHYAGRCAPQRFRADYLLMRDVFRDASERMMAAMPKSIFPIWMRAITPIMTPEIREAIVKRNFYDVTKQRRLAFERGERLTKMLLEGGS